MGWRVTLTDTIQRVKTRPIKCTYDSRLRYRIEFAWGTLDDRIRQVEVNQFDSARIVEGTEDVFGLDVAVNNAQVMNVL